MRRAIGRTPRPAAIGVAVVAAVAFAAPALACPVCYGEASDPVLDGTRLSVAFLGGLVYLLLFGGMGMVFVVRRQALRRSDSRHGLRLVSADDDGADRPRPEGEETNE